MNRLITRYLDRPLAFFSILSLLVFGGYPLHAFSVEEASGSSSEKKFNAGEMIVEHVIDNHEWHIMEIGETPVVIPLPVILWYNGKPDVFLSSEFHHGTTSYHGYKISNESPHKGKVVRTTGDTLEADPNAPLPLDFSITKNVLALFISCGLLLLIFISIANGYKKRKDQAPKGLQSLIEPVILFIRDDIAIPSIGKKKYEKYMPYLLTLFFFIFFNNLLGLIPFFPGGANLTGNIAVTMVMAIFTFIITSFSGNKAYWTHLVNAPGVPWWLKIPIPLMPIVELIGVITKPFVLMVRLFANMLAGHIIMLGFISLIFIFGSLNIALGYGVSIVSVAFAIFMNLLELLVAFIQAFVFTLLSALYFGMATEEHGHAEHESPEVI
ncbi:MAG: F0F1 ATP synthase subunit A [Bacteroidetes bacterium]|nr:F0F1 ATP synthase subunit A [Bacteroidota bacterium]